MELDAPIDPEHEKAEIETGTQSGIETELPVKAVDTEQAFLTGTALIHKPDIAHVEKQRTL